MVEAACAAAFGVLVAFLPLFASTGCGTRRAGCASRLLRGRRRLRRRAGPSSLDLAEAPLEQLARLLSRSIRASATNCSASSSWSAATSSKPARGRLCEAAIGKSPMTPSSATSATRADPRHRLWACLAAAPRRSRRLFAAVPGGGVERLGAVLAPWQDAPRYTFAALEPLAADVRRRARRAVFDSGRSLRADRRSRPGARSSSASSPRSTPLHDGRYEFECRRRSTRRLRSALATPAGDRIEPMLRPELTSVMAEVTLPDYLGRPDARKGRPRRGDHARPRQHGEIRGHGQPRPATTRSTASRAAPRARRSRAGRRRSTARGSWNSAGKTSSAWPARSRSRWRSPAARTRPPSLLCDDLPRQKVVLDSETLNSRSGPRTISASSGSASNGKAIDRPDVEHAGQGRTHRWRPAGTTRSLSRSPATFSAKSLGIEPQPFAGPPLRRGLPPGRARVYSPTYICTSSTPSSTPSGSPSS